MRVPLHLNHKSPAGAPACQPVIHSLLEWVGVERGEKRERERGSVLPLLAGPESVRAWVGRAGTWDELGGREDGGERGGRGGWG